MYSAVNCPDPRNSDWYNIIDSKWLAGEHLLSHLVEPLYLHLWHKDACPLLAVFSKLESYPYYDGKDCFLSTAWDARSCLLFLYIVWETKQQHTVACNIVILFLWSQNTKITLFTPASLHVLFSHFLSTHSSVHAKGYESWILQREGSTLYGKLLHTQFLALAEFLESERICAAPGL